MNELNIRRLLSAALFLCLGLYVFIALRLALVNDDYMALYTTWLMSVGKVPNVDFAVSSYTLLFDLFAPVYYLVGEHFEILYVFRLLFLLMLSMLAWQVFIITRFFFTSTTALITLLLLATSSAMVARGLDIRPDLPIILLWLQTIIVLYIKRYKEATKMFWVGFLFILAMLFKFKAILICSVIGIYLLSNLVREKSIKSGLLAIVKLALGSVVCLSIFTLLFGLPTLHLFIETSVDLMKYSSGAKSSVNSVNALFLERLVVKDSVYWVLAVIGVVLAAKQFMSFSLPQRHCLLSLTLLAMLSVVANPHYHTYNFVTLYPLIAIFVACSIQKITLEERATNSRKLGVFAILFVWLFARLLLYPIQHNNQHQIALHDFITSHTAKHDAVFAFEGIGLFRPSTYHWRSSKIKLDDYQNGRYNVWQEIVQSSPILIIESYRLPGWLLDEDAQRLYEHYTPITSHILAMGFATDATKQGFLLKAGWYLTENTRQNTCLVDGSKTASGKKLWLESGSHTLSSSSGLCKLYWYFPKESLDSLAQKNPSQRRFLYRP